MINAYGIDIIGTEGRIAIRESVGTTMFIHRGQHQTPAQPWEPVHLSDEDVDEQGKQQDKGIQKVVFATSYDTRPHCSN